MVQEDQKKKRILFIMPSMFIGGAEKSLIGLLEAIDYEKYDVCLFLFRHEGELIGMIPEMAELLPEIPEYTTFDRPIKDILMSPLKKYAAARLSSKRQLKRYCRQHNKQPDVWKSMQYTAKYLNPILPDIPGKYDMAVSFLGIPFYMSKVKAPVKLCWIHTDYASLDPDEELDKEAYSLVDHIVTVSKECENAFLKKYPELADKSMVIENCIPTDLIKAQAEEKIDDLDTTGSEIKLLSVGRYSEAKNFDNIPDICSRIRKQGIDAKWYIIGYGGDEALIRQKISESNMEDHVIMLGKKINPYPYINACDIYIQPSRYEGKCVTVREAQMLNKPVIITDYATSKSQLEDGVDGVIVPMDNAGCAEGIVRVIKDKEQRKRLVEKTKERDYSHSEEVSAVYRILEEPCQM